MDSKFDVVEAACVGSVVGFLVHMFVYMSIIESGPIDRDPVAVYAIASRIAPLVVLGFGVLFAVAAHVANKYCD